MREKEHERRGEETNEQREDRLQQMREMQHERRGAETEVAMYVGMVMRPEMSPPFSIQKVEIVLRDV